MYLGECNLFLLRVSKQFKDNFSVVILVKTGRSKYFSTEVNKMFKKFIAKWIRAVFTRTC